MKYGFGLKSGAQWPEGRGGYMYDCRGLPGSGEVTHDGLILHCYAEGLDPGADFLYDLLAGEQEVTW